MATAAKLVLDIDAKGVEKADGALEDLEKSAKKATRATKGLTKAEKEAASATRKLAKDTANLKRTVAGLATTYLGMAAAAKAIAIASDFGEAAATVKAITQATDKASTSYIELEKQARQLGATTRFSATQAAEAQVALLRSGLAANEVLEASASVLNLATVAQIDLARAAEITAITLKQFNLDASQAERVVDVFSTASNTAATTVEQLAEGMKFAAPVASKFGLTLEDTTATLAVLSNSGLQASLAGTGLKGVISALASPTGRAAATLQNLAKASGQASDAFDITKRPLEEIFVNFKKAEAGGKDMLDIFGLLKAPAALTLTAAADEIGAFGATLEDVTGNAQTAADTINDALKGDILSLISALEELVLTVNDSVGPSLRDFIQFATEVARALAADSDEADKFSTAANLAASAIKILTVVAIAFVAVKLVTAIGSAVIAVKAMIVALAALRFAIASTGIGLLVVGIGIAAAAALEFSGAFDDAAQSTEDLNEAGRKLAGEERERERAQAQVAATKRLRHQESIDQIKKIAEEEKAAEKVAEQAAKMRAAAAKQKQLKARAAATSLLALEDKLIEKRRVAGADSETKSVGAFIDKVEKLVAAQNKLVLKPGQGFFEALAEQEAKGGKDLSAAAEAGAKTIQRLTKIRDEALAKAAEAAVQTAGFKGAGELGQALQDTKRDLDELLASPEDQGMLKTLREFEETSKAVKDSLKEALAAPEDSEFKITFAEYRRGIEEVNAQLAELERLRALTGVISAGKDATAEMMGLADASVFTADSFSAFESASTRAIAGYRAEMQLADADTVALQESIAGVGLELEKFAEKVLQQDLLDSLESVVVSTTTAFFDLFETLLDGSKTAGEAFKDFIGVIIRALFQKFVVEQTINAIAKGFDAIGAATGLGNVGSAAAGVGNAAASLASADGNAFDRSGHAVTAFANGGIIGSPTLFPLGLAGEAGPEAIMPLSRGPDGKLGVQTTGREARRPGANPFINRSLSQGASSAPSETELRNGSSRTTNVQMNISTPDAKSFRKSKRQIQASQLGAANIGT